MSRERNRFLPIDLSIRAERITTLTSTCNSNKEKPFLELSNKTSIFCILLSFSSSWTYVRVCSSFSFSTTQSFSRVLLWLLLLLLLFLFKLIRYANKNIPNECTQHTLFILIVPFLSTNNGNISR